MSDRAAQRSIAISEALGIQDQSTTKQVEAIAALRARNEALCQALRDIDAALVRWSKWDGQEGDAAFAREVHSCVRAALAAKEEA